MREGRPITELGIPDDVDHIDAAFVWGYNKKTYFISGDMYWRYNEETRTVAYDYPRDMSMWSGVPIPVSAAFQYWDGKSFITRIDMTSSSSSTSFPTIMWGQCFL